LASVRERQVNAALEATIDPTLIHTHRKKWAKEFRPLS
jgi:hypothetical protein